MMSMALSARASHRRNFVPGFRSPPAVARLLLLTAAAALLVAFGRSNEQDGSMETPKSSDAHTGGDQISIPQPTGPYEVGTLTYHWPDTDRPEEFTPDPDDRRELMVQIWYPAMGEASSPRAPYVPDADAVVPALARLFQLPEPAFERVRNSVTNAIPSAPVAEGAPSYPVLIFMHGRSGIRQHNAFQVEELVSHGYIVAAIDQPYAAGAVVFPDGREADYDTRMNDPAFMYRMIPYLAQDVSFTLDQLAALNHADPNGILTGRLEVQRAGIFGVSLGGIVTGEACLREPRLRACLVMDAPLPADVVQAGLQQPTMWISRDAETMRSEGWTEADIDEHQGSMRAVFESLPSDGYLVLVPGMFHFNFTDVPLWLPSVSGQGPFGPIDAQRGHSIVNAYSLAFFDRHLKGEPETLLDGPAAHFPEVLFESRR
jgi:predicted dienelactone hydrolase